jgi:fructan beta-fructosidase
MFRRTILGFVMFTVCFSGRAQNLYHEQYRPQIHFSPERHWMNDPNGLVFFNGIYHLFFQYFPDSTVWGPMHWGHAVSTDLLHWKQLPIALYPDSLGYIFSGSAIVDCANTSGFGTAGKIPLIAIYTQHDPVGEKAGTNLFQNQSIAYSLDNGNSWTKYIGNPVLKTPGLKDFRDPKVSWYPDKKEWIMTLAAGDRILFYSSKNLTSWAKESDFGSGIGAHGGVWECPDLLPFVVDGKKIWLLIVNINPGGIQGGSGTQYFTGDFDGNQFIPTDTITRWTDYGPDNYAGVTYSNTGNEKIFLGWMSNWQYGTKVPTSIWRSAMTLPRILGLKKTGTGYYTTMTPISLKSIAKETKIYNDKMSFDGPFRLDFTCHNLHSFSLIFTNAAGQILRVGFDQKKNSFFIDRTKAGRSDFDPGFATIHYGPRFLKTSTSVCTLIMDNASIELFADNGLTTMTEIFFPNQPFSKMKIESNNHIFDSLQITRLASVWP